MKRKIYLFFLITLTVLISSVIYAVDPLVGDWDFSNNDFLDNPMVYNDGSVTIADGYLKQSNNDAGFGSLIYFGSQSDYNLATLTLDIKFDFNTELDPGASMVSILFRKWDPNSTYVVTFTKNKAFLNKKVWDDGPKTILIEEANLSLTDDMYTIEIMTREWIKSISVNGHKLFQLVEEPLWTGYFGIETWQGAYMIDNLKIETAVDEDRIWDASISEHRNSRMNELRVYVDGLGLNPENLGDANTILDQVELDILEIELDQLAVNTVIDQGYADLDTIIASQLLDDKEAAKLELDNYVDLDDYYLDEQNEINNILTTNKALIDGASNLEGVNQIVSDTKGELDLVLTKVDIDGKLDDYKQSLIEELEDYFDLDDYSEDNKTVLINILTTATNDINNATTSVNADQILTAAKLLVDEVLTLAEEEEIELVNYKTIKKLEINNYLKLSDYASNQISDINNIIDTASDNIDNASNISEVDIIVADTKSLLDEVLTFEEAFEDGYSEDFSNWDFVDNAHKISNEMDFDIMDNYLYQNNTGGESLILFGETNMWSDFTFTTKITPTEYLSAQWAWGKVLFRASGTGQQGAYLFNYKSNMVYLSKRDLQEKEFVIDSAFYEFEQGTEYELKIIAKDDYLAIFINDLKILEAVDSDYENGYFGFVTWQTAYRVKDLNIHFEVDENDLDQDRVFFGKDKYDFEDGKKTNLLAPAQVSVINDPYLEDNKVLRNNAKDYTLTLFGNANYKDFRMTFDLIPLGLNVDEQLLRVIYRAHGWEGNAVVLEFTKTSIKLFVNYNLTEQLIKTVPFDFIATARYEIDIQVIGNNHKLYIQGNEIYDVIEDNFGTYANGYMQMGYTGIQTWNAEYLIDNINVIEITEFTEAPQEKDYPTAQTPLDNQGTPDPDPDPDPEPDPEPSEPTDENNKTGLILGISIGLVIVGALVVGFIFIKKKR